MTQQTQVDPDQLHQALRQYCPEEIIQQVIDEPDSLYDGTPYWIIYDCLSRLGKSDETNIIRWNKVLRDLGFTSVFDPGRGGCNCCDGYYTINNIYGLCNTEHFD